MGSEVIGRQAELASAERFLDSLTAGPAALIIEGEAGIGKTILWEALLDSAARRGYVVLSSRPAESEARLSFAGLADLRDEVCFLRLEGDGRPVIAKIALRIGFGDARIMEMVDLVES
jgi:hypothetical protein